MFGGFHKLGIGARHCLQEHRARADNASFAVELDACIEGGRVLLGNAEILGQIKGDITVLDFDLAVLPHKGVFEEVGVITLGKVLAEVPAAALLTGQGRVGGHFSQVEQRAQFTARLRNVVGILRGSDASRATEAVVVGAHYDHVGRGGALSVAPEAAGEIHNGADDNASGVAALLENTGLSDAPVEARLVLSLIHI